MDHARESERVRTFLKAVIEFNKGASKVDCLVKNISGTGARLEVTSAVGLPIEFSLHIPHRGERHRAKLVWRETNSVGVRFLPAEVHEAAPVRDASSLEKENARLRARIRELTRRLEDLGQDPNIDQAE